MFFRFQNYSNFGQPGMRSPFAMAVKPLITLAIVLIVLGLLITAYPEAFAGLIAFIFYFLAALCIYGAYKAWNAGRAFRTPPVQESDSSESVKVDVKVID